MASASFLPTVGVEEEFLLLDPVSGRPRPAAPAVLRRLAGERGPQAELMRYQIEAATPVCRGLDEVRDELWRLRRLLATAAAGEGCRLTAAGISPYADPGLALLSDGDRYRELARRYPRCTAGTGTCGCHVHVAVPSRDLGVQVLARLRPWLATLLAVSANSPISVGRDTGWHSRRFVLLSRWPTARAPAVWRDGAHYDAAVRALIGRHAAFDERSVYFFARLSPRFPTVEVRMADVCPDVDTALAVAGLVRGLVMTAVREVRDRRRTPPVGPDTVAAGLAAAARFGLGGDGVDPLTGEPVPQRLLLERLRAHIDPALAEAGDRDATDRALALLAHRGTGAERQLGRWRRHPSPAELVGGLARDTLRAPAGPAAAGRIPVPPPPAGPRDAYSTAG